ncbi:MAG: hypothetical protein HW416_548 [Chloroflexi bacterium]|nr:hypothetical protein [Chloroflexota bacterium]
MNCAPASRPEAPAASDAPAPAERAPRTVVVALNREPVGLAAINPLASGFGANFPARAFNAYLELVDDKAAGRPYLSTALPQLNTDSWRVFPDGRMETRYQLKPNLTWHDGAALTADDFAFAWRVYTTPEIGVPQANTAPINIMEDVSAPSPATLLIRWKRPYPNAGVLPVDGSTNLGLPALPKHILEAPYKEERWDSFPNLPYWTTEFIGLGPYKLDRWEQGSFIEAVAFDGHALGKPKIERLRLVFIGDRNAAFANMRAGSIHLAAEQVLTFEQALELKREWATTNGGVFLFTPASTRHFAFQFRPDVLTSHGLLDVRVRRALAHSLDRQALSDALWGGEGVNLDSFFSPRLDFFPTIDRGIVKYPYDLRATERLMTEAGWARGADGFYVSPAEGRFTLDVRATVGPESEAERTTAANGWRQAGFDTQESLLSVALSSDGQARATFTGVSTNAQSSTEPTMVASFTAGQVARPENRWNGINRGGWTNGEYDRAAEAFNTQLDPAERIQARATIARVWSEELPGLMLYYNLNAAPHLSVLTGPTFPAPESMGYVGWNIHEWDMK